MNQELLYPYVLQPKLTEAIWGGHELIERYGKHGDAAKLYGESWECWDTNTVVNGVLAGKNITALRTQLGTDLVGTDIDPSRIFPVLTKIITACDWLSVQVHPDDAYAQRVEHLPNGKTECWYVLDAGENSELVMGWARDTSREEYEHRVADGTLGEILQRVPVKAGDAFYIPAGRVHAIGAGITIYETQQASDITYRMFDWNRVGADGKPRPLHIEKAADVLNYRHQTSDGPLKELAYAYEGFQRTALIAESHFLVERVTATETPAELQTHNRPLIITALADGLKLTCAYGDVTVEPYQTALIPAGASSAAARAVNRSAQFMLILPSPTMESLKKRFAGAGVAQPIIERFLGQFRPLSASV
ncbi:MAG TPA: type I phosphomannose isomerase catalytic subunit [Candidatus Baltobacteraceae bacterium]|jgi:mannose-6-phosphate isomerase|nr:type I phosphomannose isomerase catalytic subunit [Candidatus Baltobacteraceae bacterium]